MEEDNFIALSPTKRDHSSHSLRPPDIFSSLPLPLLAFSLLKSQHSGNNESEHEAKNETPRKEEKEIETKLGEDSTITKEIQTNNNNNNNNNNTNINCNNTQTVPLTKFDEQIAKEQNDEQPSWYERIKTAAISGTTGIANATAKIKYAFISKDTEEAFLHIWELMNILLKDVPFNKIDLLFGLMMLQEYYKAIPVRSHEMVRDKDLTFTAQHYMKYSGACFGAKYIHGMVLKKATGVLQGMVGGDQANINALCEYCEIHPEDVIDSKWTSTSYDPGHYLAFDHSRGALVLAIRGTFNDCLTDLVAHSVQFEDGYVHKGFYKSAMKKFELLEITIMEHLRHHPLYEFVVCGHSMGAGIACIFTLLFHKAHPDVHIHCYGFGTPCIFSPELALAPTTYKLITSIVLGDDVVPQLSIESMSKLKNMIVQLLSQSNNSLQRAFHWVASNNALSDNTLGKIASILNCTPKPEMITSTQTPNISSDSLYPPGNIYHIFKRVETTTTTTTTTTTVEPNSSSSSSSLSTPSSPSITKSSSSTTIVTPPSPAPSLSLSNSESILNTKEDIPTTTTETVKEVTFEYGDTPGSFPELENNTNNNDNNKGDTNNNNNTNETNVEKVKEFSTIENVPSSHPSTPIKVSSLPPTNTSSSSSSSSSTLTSSQDSMDATQTSQIKTTQEEKEMGYDLERSNPSLFHEIFISPSMFSDHMPHMYEHALKVMVEEYEEETKNLKEAAENNKICN